MVRVLSSFVSVLGGEVPGLPPIVNLEGEKAEANKNSTFQTF